VAGAQPADHRGSVGTTCTPRAPAASAVLLTLLDLCLEQSSRSGAAPDVLTTRQWAAIVSRLNRNRPWDRHPERTLSVAPAIYAAAGGRKALGGGRSSSWVPHSAWGPIHIGELRDGGPRGHRLARLARAVRVDQRVRTGRLTRVLGEQGAAWRPVWMRSRWKISRPRSARPERASRSGSVPGHGRAKPCSSKCRSNASAVTTPRPRMSSNPAQSTRLKPRRRATVHAATARA